MSNPYAFGTLLFDLAEDPDQEHPLADDELELHMAGLLMEQLRASDAPPEQYRRLGLPESGPVTPAHLLVRAQWEQVLAGRRGPARVEEFTCPDGLEIPLRRLLADEKSAAVLRRQVPDLVDGPLVGMAGDLTLLQIAAFAIGLLTRDRLNAVAAELAGLRSER